MSWNSHNLKLLQPCLVAIQRIWIFSCFLVCTDVWWTGVLGATPQQIHLNWDGVSLLSIRLNTVFSELSCCLASASIASSKNGEKTQKTQTKRFQFYSYFLYLFLFVSCIALLPPCRSKLWWGCTVSPACILFIFDVNRSDGWTSKRSCKDITRHMRIQSDSITFIFQLQGYILLHFFTQTPDICLPWFEAEMSQSLKVQEHTIFPELNLVVAGYTAPQGQPQSECCTQGELQMSKVIASKYFSEKHCSVALVPAVRHWSML